MLGRIVVEIQNKASLTIATKNHNLTNWKISDVDLFATHLRLRLQDPEPADRSGTAVA